MVRDGGCWVQEMAAVCVVGSSDGIQGGGDGCAASEQASTGGTQGARYLPPHSCTGLLRVLS